MKRAAPKYAYVEEHPDFEARDKRSVWIYKIDRAYTYRSGLTGHTFRGKWLRVDPDGRIVIPEEYAWNGCTPKVSLLDLWVVGAPDGIVDIDTCKPKTYYATLVHDALYQYYSWVAYSRKEIDLLFLDMMQEREFKLAWFYYAVVRCVGWVALRRKHPAREAFETALECGA